MGLINCSFHKSWFIWPNFFRPRFCYEAASYERFYYIGIILKSKFQFWEEISFLGYPELKKVALRKCVCKSVCPKPTVVSTPLYQFGPNLHQTRYFRSRRHNIGTRILNKFLKINYFFQNKTPINKLLIKKNSNNGFYYFWPNGPWHPLRFTKQPISHKGVLNMF